MLNAQIIMASLLAVTVVSVLGLTWHQLIRYRRGQLPVTRRQFIIRLLAGALLLVLLFQILRGIFTVQPDQVTTSYLLNYWTRCVVLGWLTVLLALVDLNLVLRLRRQQRRLLDELSRHLVQAPSESPGQPDPPSLP